MCTPLRFRVVISYHVFGAYASHRINTWHIISEVDVAKNVHPTPPPHPHPVPKNSKSVRHACCLHVLSRLCNMARPCGWAGAGPGPTGTSPCLSTSLSLWLRCPCLICACPVLCCRSCDVISLNVRLLKRLMRLMLDMNMMMISLETSPIHMSCRTFKPGPTRHQTTPHQTAP